MLINSKTISNKKCFKHDICIIGAGCAGVTLAKLLGENGYDVCILESGNITPNDETQHLYDFDCVGYPVRENFQNRVRYWGGTCNIWPGRTMILNKLDLKKRPWVPNSGWPISYSELLKYYEKATKLLGVADITKYKAKYWESVMNKHERSFFYSRFIKPNVSIWAKKPMRFGYRTKFYKAIAFSPNTTAYVNANVKEIRLHNNKSTVKEVLVYCLNGKMFSVRANYFILSAGGLENPRILLASRRQIPNGIANNNDIVGRYFMDHPRAIYGEIDLTKGVNLSNYFGFPIKEGKSQIGISISDEIIKHEGLLNNYISLEPKVSDATRETYQSLVGIAKRVLRKGHSGKRFDLKAGEIAQIPELIYLLTPRELFPHWSYYWGTKILKLIPIFPTIKKAVIVNYCEQPPNPQSRVFLGKDYDKLNMPKLVLDWKICDQERRTVSYLQNLLRDHISALGIGTINYNSENSESLYFTDASHHIGTTRMSEDPKTGVVDNNCRAHSVNNLFLAGSSVFPTSGHANPTLTIIALAIRLSEYLQNHVLNPVPINQRTK